MFVIDIHTGHRVQCRTQVGRSLFGNILGFQQIHGDRYVTQLLLETSGTDHDVAQQVGFNTHEYILRLCFIAVDHDRNLLIFVTDITEQQVDTAFRQVDLV